MRPEDDGILIKAKPLRDQYLSRIAKLRRDRDDHVNAANALESTVMILNDCLDDLDRLVNATKTAATQYHDPRDPV